MMNPRNRTKRNILCTLLGLGMTVFMLGALTACVACEQSAEQGQAVEAVTVQPTAQPPVETQTPTVATASFTPGTFTATAESFGGELTVEVTFTDSSIANIEVQHSDTPNWARRAIPTIPQMILHRQSTQNIDTIASATITSDAILTAVNDTIVQAGASPDALVPNIPTEPLPNATFIAGQHIVETNSWEGAPMVIQVVFSQDEIVRVQVESHGDTTTGGNWAGRAIPIIPHQVEEVQSTVGIDIIAGATTTSTNVLYLINEAITLAGADPASLQPRTRTAGTFWPYGAGGGNPAIFHPGVYYATADGFGGPLTVQAIFSRGELVRARVVEHAETENFFDMVFPSGQGSVTLATIVEEEQTIHDIDITAGATRTHNAFLEAVAEAIRMAGADPADFY
ncbi:MAG: FMN-binding protein [Defluviitaleaceae bacterium]|nr:FMN-binding protein [Defluviitaleaceae bacterium]